MRVRVYIDGFNLYYRALKGTARKWLNPIALAASLLDPSDTIVLARYFTARISARGSDPDAPKRQQVYLSALSTLPEIRIHYGRFLSKTKTRPLVSDPDRYVEVHDTEEKGSDVNLASFLLYDGCTDRYDAALVMSQDTDLIEPIRLVRSGLGKIVGVVWLDGRQSSSRFSRASSFIRHATPARIEAAQFPEAVMGRNGHLLRKPEGWK